MCEIKMTLEQIQLNIVMVLINANYRKIKKLS